MLTRPRISCHTRPAVLPIKYSIMLSQRRAGQLQARNGNCRDIFPTPFSASCHSGIVSSPPTSVVFVYGQSFYFFYLFSFVSFAIRLNSMDLRDHLRTPRDFLRLIFCETINGSLKFLKFNFFLSVF